MKLSKPQTKYNTQHWSKRIPEYLSEDWSWQPSPFAKSVAKYLPTNAKILELGTGAGQDGLWLASQGFYVVISDATNVGFTEIKKRANKAGLNNLKLTVLDVTKLFDIDTSTVDSVYAQLVLHYFDDKTMQAIMDEIRRVLKPGGIFACMVNSVKDREYNESKKNTNGLINVEGLIKRYFSLESFAPFVEDFSPILFDDHGETPKDRAKGNRRMIRFIGRKK